VRYYTITLENAYDRFTDAWGGAPTYWFEINAQGDANRQIVTYPDGTTLSYDPSYPDDVYNGLQQMVVDGDAAWWEMYRITATAFQVTWQEYVHMNRRPDYVHRLERALPPNSCDGDDEIRF
jgi:hypothetical protein